MADACRCIPHHPGPLRARLRHAISRYLQLLHHQRWVAYVELLAEGTEVRHTSTRTRLTGQIFYTLSSLYIIFLMTSVYARTREREKAWKFGMYCLLGSILITPFWYLMFRDHVLGHSTFMKVRCSHTLRIRLDADIIDSLGLFRNPRICLRYPTTAPPPSNHRTHRH